MSETPTGQTCCTRREWIGLATAAGAFAAVTASAGQERKVEPHSPPLALAAALSPEENESAKTSRMVAQALQLRREGGYNCAELILTAAVRCHDLPPRTSEAAAAFGGGVGHGELCGFLTGASMALGALAFRDGGNRAEIKKRLQGWNGALWTWWKANAALNCRDLRPLYDKAGFENMLVRVCLQFEQITAHGRHSAVGRNQQRAAKRKLNDEC